LHFEVKTKEAQSDQHKMKLHREHAAAAVVDHHVSGFFFVSSQRKTTSDQVKNDMDFLQKTSVGSRGATKNRFNRLWGGPRIS